MLGRLLCALGFHPYKNHYRWVRLHDEADGGAASGPYVGTALVCRRCNRILIHTIDGKVGPQ